MDRQAQSTRYTFTGTLDSVQKTVSVKADSLDKAKKIALDKLFEHQLGKWSIKLEKMQKVT